MPKLALNIISLNLFYNQLFREMSRLIRRKQTLVILKSLEIHNYWWIFMVYGIIWFFFR